MAGINGAVFIAGQYTLVYNGVSVGICEGDAGVPTIEETNHAEQINSSDAYGKTLIDGVYQGGDFFAQYTCLEYKAGSLAAFWPFAAIGVMGIIGRMLSDIAAPLVMTAIAGTPAANSPATLTASKAVLAPGYNTKLLFGPTLRKVPIRQVLLPYVSSSNNVWYTQT